MFLNTTMRISEIPQNNEPWPLLAVYLKTYATWLVHGAVVGKMLIDPRKNSLRNVMVRAN